MANQNMKLVLSLAGRDDGAVRLLAETERQLKRAALSRNQLARAGKPYELAGIRSERAIQRDGGGDSAWITCFIHRVYPHPGPSALVCDGGGRPQQQHAARDGLDLGLRIDG